MSDDTVYNHQTPTRQSTSRDAVYSTGNLANSDPNAYEIAIVCALKTESTAVEACLDEVFDAALCRKAVGDPNAYTLGRIGQHNVVLTYLPSIGKASSAAAAVGLAFSFQRVKLCLLVGVCGSVPRRQEEDGTSVDILLGDVIMSTGVVQYDLGRQYDNGRAVRKNTAQDNLARLPPALRSLIHKCQAGIESGKLWERLQRYVNEVCTRNSIESYTRPSLQKDILYPPEYLHRHRQPYFCKDCDNLEQQSCQGARKSTCEELGCKGKMRTQRAQQLTPSEPPKSTPALDIRIHWGLIASGDLIIKSGTIRDEIAAAENVIAFEMEGAGLWDAFPTIVVKGVCDYADSHKHKGWQKFASLTAAAAAKALLMSWVSSGSTFNLSSEISQDSALSPSCSTDVLTQNTSERQASADKHSHTWLVPPFVLRLDLVGRSTEKASIEAVLLSSDSGTGIAIEGLGGIGKSRLALEIASSIHVLQPERSIFWIRCSDVLSFERDCRRIAQALGLYGADDFSQDPKALMKRYLDNDDEVGHWLLILDSADDEMLWSARAAATPNSDALFNHIPHRHRGAVLVTTRNHKVAFDITQAQDRIVRLSQLSSPESHLMLNTLLKRTQTEVRADADSELLNLLTHLPLAIIQAAAYINQNNSDVPEYLQIWKESSEDEIMEILSEDFADSSRYQDAQNPIAKTWLISFKDIRVQYPVAAIIMSYMSCLDNKDILRSSIPKLGASIFNQKKAFSTLQNYAFIQAQQRNTNDDVFDMHRLVHLATRNYLRQLGEFPEYLQRISEHLHSSLPQTEIDNTSYWRKYLPHAEAVVQTPDLQDQPSQLNLLESIATAYYMSGAYTKSLAYRQSLIGKLTNQPRSDEVRVTRSLVELANVFRQLGRGEESINAAVKASDLSKRIFPEGCLDKIAVMDTLASAHGCFGKCETALQLSRDTVAMARACIYPSEKARLATITSTLHTLSTIHHSLHHYQKQADVLLEIIKLTNTTQAGNWIHKVQFEMQLAAAYSRLQRASDAEKILLRLRPILKERLGDYHNLTVSCASFLAEAYQFQCQYRESEALYRELLDTCSRMGRRADALVIRDRVQLACVIAEQGQERVEEAKAMHLATLGMSTLATARNSVLTLQVLEALAWAYWSSGKRLLASRILASCHRRSVQTLGHKHPDTLNRLRTRQTWRQSMRSAPSRKRPGEDIFEGRYG